MKKLVALLLALVMMLGVCSAMADNIKMDKLTLEFVPSKDADVIITGTKNLPELLKAEMANQGYDIGEIEITVGTNYNATGEAMGAGSIDVGWLPPSTYVLYSDEVDVILTSTRAGLSNDSENPADWNGDANKTVGDSSNQVGFYRALIYATPSAYGKELAAKVNAGEKLTWEDLNKANWAVGNNSSSAGYIYPTLWLMENYDGKKLTDLSNIAFGIQYGDQFAQAAAESVDIIVCYADGRRDYEAAWQLPIGESDATGKAGMGRKDTIWNELNVIGVTPGIYNDTVAITKAKPEIYNDQFKTAMQNALINIINTEEGKAIFSVYSHEGYTVAVDSDYDGTRAAQQAVK